MCSSKNHKIWKSRKVSKTYHLCGKKIGKADVDVKSKFNRIMYWNK